MHYILSLAKLGNERRNRSWARLIHRPLPIFGNLAAKTDNKLISNLIAIADQKPITRLPRSSERGLKPQPAPRPSRVESVRSNQQQAQGEIGSTANCVSCNPTWLVTSWFHADDDHETLCSARADPDSTRPDDAATATVTASTQPLSHPSFTPIPSSSTSSLDLLTAATNYPNQLAPIQNSLYPSPSSLPTFHALAASSPNTRLNLTSSHHPPSQSPSGMSPGENGAPSPATPAPGGFSLRKLLSTRPEIEPGKARSHSIAAVFATDPEPEVGARQFEDAVQAGVIPEIHVAGLIEL